MNQVDPETDRLRAEVERLEAILSFGASTVAGELVNVEKQLTQSHRDLDSIINHVPIMIGYWDRNLRNRFGNRPYADWFGVDPALLPGMDIRDVIGEETYRLSRPYIEAALRGEQQQFERDIRRPDGPSVRHCLVQYIPDYVGDQVQGFYTMVTDISPLKKAEAALVESERRFRQMFEANATVLLLIEPDSGAIVDANAAASRFYGYSMAQLRSMPIDRINTLTPAQVAAECARAVREERNYFIFPHQLASGEVRTVEVRSTPIRVDGQTLLFSIVSDVTEHHRAQEALVKSEELQRIAATAFESMQGMVITDAQQVILRVNKAFTEVTGYSAEDAIGQTPRLLKSGRQDTAFYARMWERIGRTGGWEGEIWNRRKNGAHYPQRLNISAVRNDAGVLTHYVGALSDLTSNKAAEEQINDLAYTDVLTGLPNRRHLIVRLQQAMIAGEQQQYQSALLMLDLDQFKKLNDALGAVQGDEVLHQFAKRLRASVRDGASVARLGSDEFAVLVEHLGKDSEQALFQAQTLVSQLLAALDKPYPVAGSAISCSASIGITFLGAPQEDTAEPLKRAELAMYEAKAQGRNTARFFDPQMQTVVDARVNLEAALRTALRDQQFVLYYQAQVSDRDGMVGVEALLRWVDPARGVIAPGEFIALAEETGLILPIGNWVLESACQQLALWAGTPKLAHLSMAVNVSARQFRESSFVAQVLAALARSGADPDRLKLELTESVLIADAEDVIVKMNALKARGVGFAIDDFGTGYSSLSYLKRLPLERLKIDQGFVRNILMDADDAAIARAVIAMATSMGLGVIAEGVETEAQRDCLAALGCHTYQGYLFSRPLPIHAFEALAMDRPGHD